jgi:Domain of unknown function (DUF4105)
MSRRTLAASVILPPFLVLFSMWALLRPSHDRRWTVDQSVMPFAQFEGDRVVIQGVRNFAWTSATDFRPEWGVRRYSLDDIRTAWYVLVPFSKRWRGPAHAFVSFGFADGEYLAISVEARREEGEVYGVLKGLLRRFELIYVVGTENDLIGRRAVYDGSDVFLYPIRAAPEAVRKMFIGMLERANELHARPEWYNTITNNCTLNLVHHVNAIVPGRIPSSWRVVLPGYSDEVIYGLGLIDSTASLADTRARFRVNQRAVAALNGPDFSSRIREP